MTHPIQRCVVIDMHAGNGQGIALPQLDLFTTPVSFPSAELAVQIAARYPQCEVILCEKDRLSRALLAERFLQAVILPDHLKVPDFLQTRSYAWALVLNDPNGYSEHGIETMQQIAARMRTDWIVVFNEGAFNRLLGMQAGPVRTDNYRVAGVRRSRDKYAWMAEPRAWAECLGARHMARTTRIIAGSPGFRYRVFVLSAKLSQAIRPPLWEIVV